MEGADGATPCGFDDGTNVGIEIGGPLGSEAVGDFAEDDGGAQRLFGAVVGGRDGAVFEKDEEVASAALDPLLELVAGGMGGNDAQQRVELGVEGIGIGAQRGVG